MKMSPKRAFGLLSLVKATVETACHLRKLKKEENPSGILLVMAFIDAEIAALALLSDAVDCCRAKQPCPDTCEVEDTCECEDKCDCVDTCDCPDECDEACNCTDDSVVDSDSSEQTGEDQANNE